jgi:hypothetical protein
VCFVVQDVESGKKFAYRAIPTRECEYITPYSPAKYSSSERVVIYGRSVRKMHRWSGSGYTTQANWQGAPSRRSVLPF